MRTIASVVAEKRRKIGNGELKTPFVQITTEEDTCASAGDHDAVSCFSINGATEELEFTDLKVEFETLARYDLDTRASKPSTEVKAGSGSPEMLKSKPSTTISSRRTVPPAELEEFFTAAEKDLHKRFKDKYNYDIVNDTPSEGRFEWVQLQLKP